MVGPGKHEPFLVLVFLGLFSLCFSLLTVILYFLMPIIVFFGWFIFIILFVGGGAFFLSASFLMLVVFRYLPLVYHLLSDKSSALLIFHFPTLCCSFFVFHLLFLHCFHFSSVFFLGGGGLFLKLSFAAFLFFPLQPSSLARPSNNFHIAMGLMGAIQNDESQRSGLTQQQQIQNIDTGNRQNCDTHQWLTSHESRGPVPNLLANLDRFFSTLRLF